MNKYKYLYVVQGNYGYSWEDLADDMKTERQNARELISAMRTERKAGKTTAPAICEALRAQLARMSATYSKHKAERSAIADNFQYLQDGKFFTVAQFAAANL